MQNTSNLKVLRGGRREVKLVFDPCDYAAWGLTGALIIERVRWFCANHEKHASRFQAKFYLGGAWWMQSSMSEFAAHFGDASSLRTVKRAIAALESGGVLTSCQPNLREHVPNARVKFYRVVKKNC